MTFKKVGVLGSGVMGMGIAAHFANAGVEVVLLDLPGPQTTQNRGISRDTGKSQERQSERLADQAIAKALNQTPSPFMHRRNAHNITTGSLDDDLGLLADCDWVIEVIIENLNSKQNLYTRLEEVIDNQTIVTSNTSTFPLRLLTARMSAKMKSHFAITHFFNPPRYMPLLELVRGPDIKPEALDRLSDFCDRILGKGVVECKDSPAFIANRLGQFWTAKAMRAAFDRGLRVEEADALNGKPFGIPKTGVFALMDLVGIDLIPLINQSMRVTLPADDPFLNVGIPPMIETMLVEGYTGRKGKGGFYRLDTDADGIRFKLSRDLITGDYDRVQQVSMKSLSVGHKGPRALIEEGDEGSAYAWEVFSTLICYAAEIADTIAYSTQAIDDAMEWGYAWRAGPFRLLDKLGVDWFVERLESENRPVPELIAKAKAAGRMYTVNPISKCPQILNFDGTYTDTEVPDGVILLEHIKQTSQPVMKNTSAALWDVGDGVLCLEFTAKAQSLDNDVMTLIKQTVCLIEEEETYKALVLYNDGTHFSVGANLDLVIHAINTAQWPFIDSMIREGQEAYKALRFAPFPVVAAPFGYAVGGGCEICLHADAIQAAAEAYIGLVEVGVGLIPGWGGCKEMIRRHMSASPMSKNPMLAINRAFESISTAKVTTSAQEAQDMLILNDASGVTFRRARLLADAKACALAMVENYEPPIPEVFTLPGPSGRAVLNMAIKVYQEKGLASRYDVTLAEQLAYVLTGGDVDNLREVSEQDILNLEREAFTALVKNTETQARITHMLETGKPLRN